MGGADVSDGEPIDVGEIHQGPGVYTRVMRAIYEARTGPMTDRPHEKPLMRLLDTPAAEREEHEAWRRIRREALEEAARHVEANAHPPNPALSPGSCDEHCYLKLTRVAREIRALADRDAAPKP